MPSFLFSVTSVGIVFTPYDFLNKLQKDLLRGAYDRVRVWKIVEVLQRHQPQEGWEMTRVLCWQSQRMVILRTQFLLACTADQAGKIPNFKSNATKLLFEKHKDKREAVLCRLLFTSTQTGTGAYDTCLELFLHTILDFSTCNLHLPVVLKSKICKFCCLIQNAKLNFKN